MKTNDSVTGKMYKDLYMTFRKIANTRFTNGLDKKYDPIKVQKKTLKHPFWKKIEDDLKIAQFVDDTKGQFTQFNVFTFIAFCVLVILVFAGWIYAQGIIYDVFLQVGYDNEINAGSDLYVNMTQAAQVTFGNIYQSILVLRVVAVVYILAVAGGLLVVNFLVRANPIWFFVYILIALVAVVTAPQVSNAYYTISQSGVFGGELNNFAVANWLVLNLPIIVAVVGVIGSIALFINLIRGNYDIGAGL